MKYHLFRITLASAGLFVNKSQRRMVTRWRAGQGISTFEQGAE